MVTFKPHVLLVVRLMMFAILLMACAPAANPAAPTTAAAPTDIPAPTLPPTTEPVPTEAPTEVPPTEAPPTEVAPTEAPTEVATTEPEPTSAAGIEAGLSVYAANGCGGCHTLTAAGAEGVVGPSHDGVGATAANRVMAADYTGEATSAEEYIRESILNPTAYTVQGYPEGVMPAFTNIDEADLDALVTMLLQQ